MSKRKILLIALLIAVIALYAFSELYDSSIAVSYSEFYELLEEEKIAKATLGDEYIHFTLKDETVKYKTPNPASPTLKEELLLKDVDIKNENDTTLDTAINYLIDFIFIIIVGGAAIKLIGSYRSTFRIVKHTGVHFSDIAGMEGLKHDMALVVDVLKGKKVKGVREISGIILEGPPGNGKTMFAKALAEEADVKFIASKGADFQGAVMGLGPAKVKMLFGKARRSKPCIIFIDEFDSIGEKRSYEGSGIDKENNRILTTLLNEMDGFTSSRGVLVIAATNSYESLDPALIRPGRFDVKIHVGNPDRDARIRLFELYGKDKSFDSSITPSAAADMFDGLSSSAIEALLNEAQMMVSERGGVIGRKELIEASRKIDVKLK